MKKKSKEKSVEELIQEHVRASEEYDKASEAADKAQEVQNIAYRAWRDAANVLKKRLAL